jgi:amidase
MSPARTSDPNEPTEPTVPTHANKPADTSANQRPTDSVFIHLFPDPTLGTSNPATDSALRIAVKDLIDMEGIITTAGCQAVASTAVPALTDAPLLTEMRRLESLGRVRFVGKTNLHELAFGADGINQAYGTPANPLDPGRVPGGSSSGSAVAVATGVADIALGSDTGGSIRIPATCCGTVGLKTSWGRIPVKGVWPLAPFLDTVGPMARTVTQTAQGLAMLDPSFSIDQLKALSIRTIGRIRVGDTAVDPAIDTAVDAALLATGVAVLDIALPYRQEVHRAGITVILAEAWRGNRFLLEDPKLAALVHPATAARLQLGESITDDELRDARLVRAQTADELARLFQRFDVLALPTLSMFPPQLGDAQTAPLTALTRFANLTGLPALSLPVPVTPPKGSTTRGTLPASIQLIGPMHRDDLVLAAGLLVEQSVRSS